MKVYVDNSITRRLIDGINDVNRSELEALNSFVENPDIIFLVSDVMRDEIITDRSLDGNGKARMGLMKLWFKIFPKVSTHSSGMGLIGDHPIGSVPIGGWVEYPEFTILKKWFSTKDAEHVFQSIRNDCDYFLTIDIKTILKKRKLNSLHNQPCH